MSRRPLEWLRISEKETRRYWSKVAQPDAETGCMVWLGYVSSVGYGRFNARRGGRTLTVPLDAHRVGFILAGGTLDADSVVDHICLNRACQNPTHLRPATLGQNQQHRTGANRNSRSGARGVIPDRDKWRVQIGFEGRTIGVGTYATVEEAQEAATAARLELLPYAHPEMRR